MSGFIFISPEQHFTEAVQEASRQRKIKTFPAAETYLVHLLKHYLDSKNLFTPFQEDSQEKPPQTLAEMYLIAIGAEPPKNKEIMKVLADRALYLSGFFGDSLQRKIIDVDYYVEMGSAAYYNLSVWSKEDVMTSVYASFSKKFGDYVDLLSYISEKSQVSSDQSVLRLYEKYIKTGSELARDKLHELGVVTMPKEQLKLSKA